MSFLSFSLILLSQYIFSQSSLNEDQLNNIELAREMGLPVIVTEVEVSGNFKTVVLLGERHIKEEDVANVEKDLIDSFSIRLMEGYSGNGGEPWLKEKAVATLVEVYSSIKKRTQNLKTSSIGAGGRRGFMVRPDGYVLYNGCYVGFATEDGFFHTEKGIHHALTHVNYHQRGEFFSTLKGFTEKIVTGRQYLHTDDLNHAPVRVGFCKMAKEVSPLHKAFSIGIELGNLRDWNRREVCGDISCTYFGSGKPSTRELRMLENIVLNLNLFEDESAFIVVVGSRHLSALEEFLPKWESVRSQYQIK